MLHLDGIDFYNKIHDMTVGAGEMPEYFRPLRARLEKALGRELTVAEAWDAEQAWQRCYQEFNCP